jgi:hypothetical protein
MKTRLFILFVTLSVIAVGISSCGSQATNPPAAAPTDKPSNTPTPDLKNDPRVKIVLDMVAKLNAGDVDGSLAYFSDDAMSYFIGMPPTGIEVYRGGEGLRPAWEYSAGDNFRWEVEIESVDYDIVKANTHTYMNFTEQLGVAPNDFVDYFLVKDSKITNYASVMTEESLAEFKPALLAVMPMESSQPSTEAPVSELTVTFTDGTCSTPGSLVLKAGELKVNAIVEDTSQEKYAISMFTLDDGKDMVDLMSSSSMPIPPEWSKTILLKELLPGQTKDYTLNIKEGPVYLVCWARPFELPIGNAGPYEVVP